MATLTWYGHATWLLDTGKHKVLVDPYFDDNPASPIKADKAAADFILLTHGHEDHTADAVKVAKRTGATVLCNWEIHLWLEKHGVKNSAGDEHRRHVQAAVRVGEDDDRAS